LLLILSVGTLTACGEQAPQQQEENTGSEQTFQKDVTLGIVEWPGVTQKTYVLKEVLDNLGYEVKINTFTVPILLKAVSTGDVDAFAGTWFNSLGDTLQQYIDDGTIVVLGNNVEKSLYRSAVPTYVYEAGVKSLADLDKYADKFDRKIYGIEPGNAGNEIMMKAVDNDTYGLGDWKVLESSTSAMLASVERATESKEWIVFSGWKPHWMNVAYDMKYLDDPESIWGKPSKIGTIARSGLPEDDPNLTRFLKQFKINSEIQSAWIMEYGKKKRDPEVVAKEWVADNLDVVNPWLEGVKTVDGQDAQKVVQQAY